MCELIFAMALALCPDYYEVALGVHSYKLDAHPEVVGFGNPIFTGTVGWDIVRSKQHSFAFELTHVSGVPTAEYGLGLNTANLRYRYVR